MRPVLNLLVVSVCVLGLAGCVYAPINGVIWNDVKWGDTATSAPSGSNIGSACAEQWFWVVGIGDASVEAAKANGNVSTVSSVDHTTTSLLGGIWGQWCTVVRGS